MIFDTLQSRHREVVPEHIAENGQLDRTLTAGVRVTELTCIIRHNPLNKSQSNARTFDGKRNVSVLKMTNLGRRLKETAPQPTFRLSRDNVSEIECAPTGQPGVPYEFSYARFLGEV